VIKLPSDIQIEEVPLDVRYRGVLKGLLRRIKGLYEAIYTRYGEDGLDLIREVSLEYGSEIASSVRKDDQPWDINRVGLFLVKVFNNMRSEGEVKEFTDNRVTIMVPECPYPFEHAEICAAHTSMERALVKGLNPELEYVIERCIPRGDCECHHVLTLGKTIPKTID